MNRPKLSEKIDPYYASGASVTWQGIEAIVLRDTGRAAAIRLYFPNGPIIQHVVPSGELRDD